MSSSENEYEISTINVPGVGYIEYGRVEKDNTFSGKTVEIKKEAALFVDRARLSALIESGNIAFLPDVFVQAISLTSSANDRRLIKIPLEAGTKLMENEGKERLFFSFSKSLDKKIAGKTICKTYFDSLGYFRQENCNRVVFGDFKDRKNGSGVAADFIGSTLTTSESELFGVFKDGKKQNYTSCVNLSKKNGFDFSTISLKGEGGKTINTRVVYNSLLKGLLKSDSELVNQSHELGVINGTKKNITNVITDEQFVSNIQGDLAPLNSGAQMSDGGVYNVVADKIDGGDKKVVLRDCDGKKEYLLYEDKSHVTSTIPSEGLVVYKTDASNVQYEEVNIVYADKILTADLKTPIKVADKDSKQMNDLKSAVERVRKSCSLGYFEDLGSTSDHLKNVKLELTNGSVINVDNDGKSCVVKASDGSSEPDVPVAESYKRLKTHACENTCNLSLEKFKSMIIKR